MSSESQQRALDYIEMDVRVLAAEDVHPEHDHRFTSEAEIEAEIARWSGAAVEVTEWL